jgi:hypothetical protein
MNKKLLLLLCVFFTCFSAVAQNRYAVQLTDKNNSPFSISNPLAFLSQRAIDRRNTQGIAITTHDFPVNPSYVSQIAATGATVINSSRWLNTVTIETSSAAVLAAVNALPFVQQVYNVGRMASPFRTTDKFTFETPYPLATATKNSSSVLSFNYGPSENQIAMLGGDILHDQGKTGQGMVIAVIDAGFFNADNMIVFDSLRNQNRLLGTWDFVDQNNMVYDDHAHGTYVTSIMAGNWPGNLVGTAPHASYWLLRSEYAPTETLMEEFYWAAAAEFADSAGADIINSSLGYYEFDDPNQNHTYADMNGITTPVSRAAAAAASKGIIVCNSAGNEGASNWNYIIAPADADSIVSVGAVNDQQLYAWFSSNGPTSDGRVKPTVAAQGEGTFVADLSNNGVFAGNGTSFSSPVIAGMMACLWQCNPNATNLQVIEALKQSASQFSNPDTNLGYGIPNMPIACQILASLSVPENEMKDLLLLGQNPFTFSLDFTFRAARSHSMQVLISDLSGKTVYRNLFRIVPQLSRNFSIRPELAPGVYLLSIVTESGILNRKVVKL